jgi:ribosomal protein L11 methyltransferase
MKPNASYEKSNSDTIWTEFSVSVTQNVSEAVADRLIELGSQGVVFEDVSDEPAYCVIKAYYPESCDIEELQQKIWTYLDELRALELPVGSGELTIVPIAPEDWSSNWKQYFKPLRIGERLVVKPSWETFDAQANDVLIEIDPGMAFGTGLHASTRLCLRLLERYIHPGDRVLDVGTGSGILSIAAARLGAEYVLAVDVDAEAVDIARENLRGNAERFDVSLQQRIDLQVGSLDTIQVTEKFDCIVMNIRPNIILPLIPYAVAVLQTGGALIISGILEDESAELIHEIRTCDLLVQNHQVEDEWIAYVLSHMDNVSPSSPEM